MGRGTPRGSSRRTAPDRDGQAVVRPAPSRRLAAIPGDPPGTTAALHPDGVIALMLDKQHLGAGSDAGDVLAVVDDLLGLHATVTTSPYLQLRARMRTFIPGQLDMLLDAGSAAKLACMRRTVFVESAEAIPLVFAATRELAARGRDRFLAANGLTPGRYERLAERAESALAGRALDARELRDAVGATERLSPVIIVMCDQGRLVRWSGSGGWQSARPKYRRFAEALPSVQLDSWEEAAAIRALVGRYVRRYGPVSESDVAWWTGLPMVTVRDALASVPNLVHATVDGLRGIFLIHEADIARAQQPAALPAGQVCLLPVLDPYLQGYRHRERCVDPRHHPFVVDRGGNVTSVILIDGRAGGVWDFVAKPSPELRLFFFALPDAQARRVVHALAAELAGTLTDGPALVVERDHMRPLTQGTAGSFLSPLNDPR